MNTLWLCLSEGVSGLRRSKLSGMLTIVTVALSIFLLGVFYLLSANFLTLLNEIKARVVVEAFLSDELSNEAVAELNRELFFREQIDSVYYVSKEEALQIFKETFGEDYTQLIEENPLPASFQIFPSKAYLNSDSVHVLIEEISKLNGIESVVYRGAVLQLLDEYYETSVTALIIAGLTLSFIGFVLVANNIRLTIAAKARIIETMLLVGATRFLVRGPFLVQGLLEGLAGSLIAGLLLSGLMTAANTYFGKAVILTPPYFWSAVLVVGCAYGIVGSLVALRGRV